MVMAEGTAGLRRNRPGTRSKDFYNWPDESFEEMDSTLAVQQYIQQNIRSDCSNIDKILEPPEGQDEGVWKYEHLRQFCLELNGLAVKLQSECHPETCSQMTATEQWIFLCAAHKTPKECPAIDYTRHTLDGAACLLNSNKYFPSRSGQHQGVVRGQAGLGVPTDLPDLLPRLLPPPADLRHVREGNLPVPPLHSLRGEVQPDVQGQPHRSHPGGGAARPGQHGGRRRREPGLRVKGRRSKVDRGPKTHTPTYVYKSPLL